MGDHYWIDTFFKLQVAGLVQFKKIVLLDSDLLILKNIDHLFELQSYTAAVAGQYLRPQYKMFNSGVMVLEPSFNLLQNLIDNIYPAYEIACKNNVPLGDQDVFQQAFPNWYEYDELKLDESYNVFWKDTTKLCRTLFENGINDIYVVHFIGAFKPWQYKVKNNLKTLVTTLFEDGNFLRYKLLKKYEKNCKF